MERISDLEIFLILVVLLVMAIFFGIFRKVKKIFCRKEAWEKRRESDIVGAAVFLVSP